MSKMLKVRNVNDYSRYLGCKEQHPLVSVIDTPSEYSQRVRG